MHRIPGYSLFVGLAVVLAGLLTGSGTAAADPYISMGDSTSTSIEAGGYSSYVDLLYSGFGSHPGFEESLGADEHIALARGGEILPGLKSRQLPVALEAINAADDTKAVTVAIGANDTLAGDACFGLESDCAPFRASYRDMVSQLKEALDRDPGDEFFGLLSYYNPYKWEGSGFSQQDQDDADLALFGTNLTADQCQVENSSGLNDIIFQAGSEYGARVADPYDAFLAGGGSFMRDPTHANGFGDLAIAVTFLDPVMPIDCNAPPPEPSCDTDPNLCQPLPSCENDATLCPADTLAPQTRFTSKPARRSKKHRAVFRFRSTETGSTFKCRLDRKQFRRCGSPRIYRKLRPGKHVFKVKAVDRAGNADATPARYLFRVRRR